MPTVAGWLTGEQVPQEVIEQTLNAMGTILGRHGGQVARTIHSGAGLIAFPDQAYAMTQNTDPPVLDWVPDRRTMVYRRPLSGAHALYYVENWPAQGNLLFASEIKALLAVGVPRRLHLPAIDVLLRYGFIPAPWTAFQNIHVVPAGSILRWQRAQTVVNHATDYQVDESLSPADAADQLYTLLDETTASLLPPHEELVALSGGDTASALTIALAAQHTKTPFSVASIGYKKGDWTEAKRIASACKHPFLEITGVDSPEYWVATIAGLEAPSVDSIPLALHQLLHTTASETGARVAISGLGAEIIVGKAMPQFISTPDQTHTQATLEETLHWYSQTASAHSPTGAEIWSQDATQLIQQAEPWEELLHARKLARRASQLPHIWQQWHYLDLHLRLPDLHVSTAQQLATAERMVVRSPYLHTDVMNMFMRLPTMLDDGTSRDTILTTLLQRSRLHTRTIQPFASLVAPTASLLCLSDFELLQQTLSPEALQATGIFNPEAVQALLRQRERGRAPRELVLMFTTQLLCQLFEVGL